MISLTLAPRGRSSRARILAVLVPLRLNSLRSAWTPFLAGLPDSQMQAKGDSEAHLGWVLRTELYSLSNWYKLSVRPVLTWVTLSLAKM
jgi:hypothetical protein